MYPSNTVLIRDMTRSLLKMYENPNKKQVAMNKILNYHESHLSSSLASGCCLLLLMVKMRVCSCCPQDFKANIDKDKLSAIITYGWILKLRSSMQYLVFKATSKCMADGHDVCKAHENKELFTPKLFGSNYLLSAKLNWIVQSTLISNQSSPLLNANSLLISLLTVFAAYFGSIYSRSSSGSTLNCSEIM